MAGGRERELRVLTAGGKGEDMENLDVMVLRQLRDWRAAGKRALLATVVRSWGS